MRLRGLPAFIGLLTLLAWGVAAAHSPGSGFITLDLRGPDDIVVTTDLAIVDLAQVLPMDRNLDGRVTWGEVLHARQPIAAYIRANLRVARDDGGCMFDGPGDAAAIVSYSGVPHVSLPFGLKCPAGEATFALDYGLFFAIDPSHRGIVKVLDGNEQLLVLSDERRTARITAGEDIGAAGMVREGISHILAGYDHLLFLLMLILPAVSLQQLRRRTLQLAGIVTAFTLAHSVTLALASTGIVTLPGKPVEVAIAASIVVAALVNILRPGHRIGWQLAFAFGLLHGFGFAGALAEIGLSSGALFRNLLAFNVGVELGQLLVVVTVLPLLLALSLWPRYRAVVIPSLSTAGAAMGLLWTALRL